MTLDTLLTIRDLLKAELDTAENLYHAATQDLEDLREERPTGWSKSTQARAWAKARDRYYRIEQAYREITNHDFN